ncbi:MULTISPECIES: hypothetical protein [unclassified Kribbella]|uniref:hypothetical protein n=1 Tax=unclassified Kribbella TaxID=2644121 RepID=UPI0030176084
MSNPWTIIHAITTPPIKKNPPAARNSVPTIGRHHLCFAVRARRWYGVLGGAATMLGSRTANWPGYGGGPPPHGGGCSGDQNGG